MTISGGSWNNNDLGFIAPSQVLKIGATAFTLENASNVVKPATTFLNYRVYQVGGTVPAFTTLNLAEVGGTICSDSKISKFNNSTANTIFTTPATNGDGVYIIELFYSAQLNDNSYLYLNNNGNNYKARFKVFASVASTLTATDIFESYAFLKTSKTVGAVTTTTTDFYELDAAYGSKLEKGFIKPLGTFPPGTNFYLGAETKTYKTDASAHKVCECSSWYYIYKSTETAPQATDFPLPADGTDFIASGNGLFMKSATLGEVSGTFNAVESTSNNTYNGLINHNVKKFQNGATSTDTEMIFPTCIGDFKIAIALMAKFSSTGDCSQTFQFILQKRHQRTKAI